MSKFSKVFVLLISIFVMTPVMAVELQSTNYKITGLTVNGGGDIEDSGSGTYSLVSSVGEVLLDDRFSSSSYTLYGGPSMQLVANVPLVACLETDTEGGTSCSDGDLGTEGMVLVCGYGGCYDRARVEIDGQGNPVDTLYSIQIKKTLDTVWGYVDAATFLIEDIAAHDINDYLSETAWEGTVSNVNILGLMPGTEYQVRITALNGDFTESAPSPSGTTTTAVPLMAFDFDIAGTGGSGTDTNAPYIIPMGTLSTSTNNMSSDLVWMDVNTNAMNGVTVYVNDSSTGLYSILANHTISSADNTQIDLSVVDEGFGLLEYSIAEEALGPVSIAANFDNGGNVNSSTVGGVSTTARELLSTTANPIYNGRVSFSMKSKIISATPASGDYSDELTFTMIPSL